MAGCKYETPTKQDVLTEMKSAFNTLDNYLETPEGMTEEVPDISTQLISYIKILRQEIHIETLKDIVKNNNV